jgi:Predicted periplasmic lipoprotein
MRRIWLIAIAAFVLVVAILTPSCLTVVKIGEESRLTGVVSFEDSLDIAGFWQDIVAEVKDTSVDLGAFLDDSAGDLTALAGKYGRYTMGNSGNLNYAVRGVGKVTSVNTASKAGSVTVQLDGYNGPVEVQIQIGEVFKEMTLRDYLSFININDYSDQIQFAQLSKSINRYVLENVVNPLDPASLEGQVIRFWGCFTYRGNNRVLITPVVLEKL